MKQHEIEEVLEPGEKLVWEGRPVFYPRPAWWLLAVYAFLCVSVIGLPVVGILTTVIAAQHFGATGVNWSVSFFTITAASGPGSTNTFNASMPGPVVVGFVVALIVFSEIERVAYDRARRFGITDRRVLALDKTGKLKQEKRGAHRAVLEKKSVVYGSVRIDRIVDPLGVLSALADDAPR